MKARCSAIAHSKAFCVDPNEAMKPSPMVLISVPAWAAKGLARDALVLAQDLAAAGVAQALHHGRVGVEVGEEDRAEGAESGLGLSLPARGFRR